MHGGSQICSIELSEKLKKTNIEYQSSLSKLSELRFKSESSIVPNNISNFDTNNKPHLTTEMIDALDAIISSNNADKLFNQICEFKGKFLAHLEYTGAVLNHANKLIDFSESKFKDLTEMSNNLLEIKSKILEINLIIDALNKNLTEIDSIKYKINFIEHFIEIISVGFIISALILLGLVI